MLWRLSEITLGVNINIIALIGYEINGPEGQNLMNLKNGKIYGRGEKSRGRDMRTGWFGKTVFLKYSGNLYGYISSFFISN